MRKSQFVLYNFTWQGSLPPDIEEVLEKYRLAKSDIDSNFGIIEIDPEKRLFSMSVKALSTNKLDSFNDLEGPFSNPAIGTFEFDDES